MHHEMQCFFATTEVMWMHRTFWVVSLGFKSYLIAAHSKVVR